MVQQEAAPGPETLVPEGPAHVLQLDLDVPELDVLDLEVLDLDVPDLEVLVLEVLVLEVLDLEECVVEPLPADLHHRCSWSSSDH